MTIEAKQYFQTQSDRIKKKKNTHTHTHTPERILKSSTFQKLHRVLFTTRMWHCTCLERYRWSFLQNEQCASYSIFCALVSWHFIWIRLYSAKNPITRFSSTGFDKIRSISNGLSILFEISSQERSGLEFTDTFLFTICLLYMHARFCFSLKLSEYIKPRIISKAFKNVPQRQGTCHY